MRFLLILFLLFSSSAFAARPMLTDDARLVDAKSCQLETWVKENKDNTEYWALPACNFTGNLEVTVGGAMGKDNNNTETTDIVYQAKTLFKQLDKNGWGVGLVVGNVRHPQINTESNVIGNLYAYVPTSFSFLDDRVVIHTNLGALHSKDEKHTYVTWGLGSETEINSRTYFIGEVFGQNKGNPFFQLGVRYWLLPKHVQFDTTYGNRMNNNSDEQWFSIGLRLLSNPILP